MKSVTAMLAAAAVFMTLQPAAAITYTAFGSNGEGGSSNGQTLTIGTGGTTYELDCFLHINGQDINGANPGTSAKLSRDGVPTNDVTFSFSPVLSADSTDLTLTYTFKNTGSNLLQDVRVLVFFDGEIDQFTNTFYNEYGEQAGTIGAGALWWISFCLEFSAIPTMCRNHLPMMLRLVSGFCWAIFL